MAQQEEGISESARGRRLPLWFQDAVAALMVPLLIGAIYGVFSIRDTVNDLVGDFAHMKENNTLVHNVMERDIAVLNQWKTEFGRKARFGLEDATDMKEDIREVRNRQEEQRRESSRHNEEANTYIEQIKGHTRSIGLLMNMCQGRGSPVPLPSQ